MTCPAASMPTSRPRRERPPVHRSSSSAASGRRACRSSAGGRRGVSGVEAEQRPRAGPGRPAPSSSRRRSSRRSTATSRLIRFAASGLPCWSRTIPRAAGITSSADPVVLSRRPGRVGVDDLEAERPGRQSAGPATSRGRRGSAGGRGRGRSWPPHCPRPEADRGAGRITRRDRGPAASLRGRAGHEEQRDGARGPAPTGALPTAAPSDRQVHRTTRRTRARPPGRARRRHARVASRSIAAKGPGR